MGNSPYMRDLLLTRTLLDRGVFPALFVSLHDDDPAGSGLNEVQTPRRALTLARTAAGVAVNTEEVEFVSLPVTVVTHYGIWSEERGGMFLTSGKWLTKQPVLEGQNIRLRANDLVIRFQE